MTTVVDTVRDGDETELYEMKRDQLEERKSESQNEHHHKIRLGRESVSPDSEFGKKDPDERRHGGPEARQIE